MGTTHNFSVATSIAIQDVRTHVLLFSLFVSLVQGIRVIDGVPFTYTPEHPKFPLQWCFFSSSSHRDVVQKSCRTVWFVCAKYENTHEHLLISLSSSFKIKPRKQ